MSDSSNIVSLEDSVYISLNNSNDSAIIINKEKLQQEYKTQQINPSKDNNDNPTNIMNDVNNSSNDEISSIESLTSSRNSPRRHARLSIELLNSLRFNNNIIMNPKPAQCITPCNNSRSSRRKIINKPHKIKLTLDNNNNNNIYNNNNNTNLNNHILIPTLISSDKTCSRSLNHREISIKAENSRNSINDSDHYISIKSLSVHNKLRSLQLNSLKTIPLSDSIQHPPDSSTCINNKAPRNNQKTLNQQQLWDQF